MRIKLSVARLGVCSALAALIVLVISGGGSAAAGDQSASTSAVACKPAKNVEAIIDDSGSMSASDPAKFRLSLLNAFVNIGTNNGLVFGGGEFGSAYNPLFGPGTIPGVITPMQASFVQVDSDNGGTDYQEAFAGATAHNGAADARIFLTDGLATPPTSHLAPRVKTYVIALGADFASDPDAQALLGQIAADTGGPAPFLVVDPSQIQAVAGAITAAINCKKPPLTFTNLFDKQGEQVGYAFKPDGKSADILISWGNPTTLLDPAGFSIQGGRGGGASSSLATLAKKGKAKIKVKEKKGATFVTVKLKGLKKGKKVKFKVKAKKLSAPTVGTTQIIR